MRQIRPCVTGAIFNLTGEILLIKRATVVANGLWGLPGGMLKGGEDWLVAFRRKMFGEVGVVVPAPIFVGLYSDPKLNLYSDPRFPESGPFHYISALFLVRSYQGPVIHSSESTEFRWVKPTELPDPLLPSELPKIQDATQFQGQVLIR